MSPSRQEVASQGDVTVRVDGSEVRVRAGSTVATAVLAAGGATFRRSVSGQPRGPLCGMGTCYECRVTVNGRPHVRACMTTCSPGMEVRTDA